MIESLIVRMCLWVAKRCQLRSITRDDESPYLDRYYLFGSVPKYFPEEIKPRLSWLPWTFFLHHFRDSDRDVELHNHPWSRSVSFVLAGGYVEERMRNLGETFYRHPKHGTATFTSFEITQRVVKPLRINVIKSDDFHRVTLMNGRDAWTLFVTGHKAQTWVFWSPITGEYVPWREHLARRKEKNAPVTEFAGEA